jgi:hypothetical protein
MSLTNLSISHLRSIIGLLEKKEQLEGEIAKLQVEIDALSAGKTAKAPKAPAKAKASAPAKKAPAPVKTAKVKAAPAKSAKPGKRSSLKESILEILEKAGSEGVAVLDIATQLRAKPGGIHVWFSTTGKKSPEIVKVAPGRYAIKKK